MSASGPYETSEALHLIAQRLRDSGPGIPRGAILDLAETADPDAIACLATGVKDPEGSVRRQAAEALGGFDGLAVADALAPVPADDNPGGRADRTAANSLAEIKDPEATADADNPVQRALANAPGFCGTAEARDSIRALPLDPDWQVRETAAEAAGSSGDTEAMAVLRDLLDDEYRQVRLKAIRGLGLLKARGAITAVGAALAGGMRNFQKEAAAALGEIADPGSLPLPLEYADDPDPDVRKNVRWTIRRIRPPP